MKTLVLAILDGWGIGEPHQGNPIIQTPTPTFDWIKQNFPAIALQASGIAVGLPWGEEGNSEVGHLTIGAGRVIFQHFPRITMSIKDGSFFSNPALIGAFEHTRRTGGRVHLLGLLTSGNVHASYEHLTALLQLAKEQNAAELLLHLFTDGRDSAPQESLSLLKKLDKDIKEIGVGTIASLSGRFYAMDRDKRWQRTQAVYDLLTKGGRIVDDLGKSQKETYDKGLNDEYVEPVLIGTPQDLHSRLVRSGDALIFFNFREDRVAQLAESFADPGFAAFPRNEFQNLYVATMTECRPGLTEHVAFVPQKVNEPLAKIISDCGKRQLHIAESQKAAHVTYFFDGLRTEPFPRELWVIVPSPTSFRFDEKPELASAEIMNRLTEALEEDIYEFIVVNFANPDLIAHTGNFDAARKAVRLMDAHMNRLSQICLAKRFPLIITSDHGNIENMLNPITGIVETRHNISPVPFYLVDKRFYRPRSEEEIKSSEKDISGKLTDIAPTILNLLNLPKSPEMSGESLLPLCR